MSNFMLMRIAFCRAVGAGRVYSAKIVTARCYALLAVMYIYIYIVAREWRNFDRISRITLDQPFNKGEKKLLCFQNAYVFTKCPNPCCKV